MMSRQFLTQIEAKKYVRGRQRQSEIIATWYVGYPDTSLLFDAVTQHAVQMDIDVIFHVNIFINVAGLIAEQYKASSPKTRWTYYISILEYEGEEPARGEIPF